MTQNDPKTSFGIFCGHFLENFFFSKIGEVLKIFSSVNLSKFG